MKKLITGFIFNDAIRNQLVFSDVAKVRLNTEDKQDQRIQLKSISGEFPTDTDISVKTPLLTPGSIKKWLLIEVIGETPENTSIKYRLNNGTREIYHDGANWITAGATDWNTIDEINNNIETFIFDNLSFGLVVNLATTSKNTTPTINEIKILGLFDFNSFQDVIDTVLQNIHDSVRPVTEICTDVLTTTDTFDLSGDYKIQTDYNFTNGYAVYDTDDDPLMLNNLFNDYTPGIPNQDGETFGPGVLTTTSPITSGHNVVIKMEYVPEVAMHTDEDFYEVSKIPSINIESVTEVRRNDNLSNDELSAEDASKGDFVRDFQNNIAIQVQQPAQIDLRFDFIVICDLTLDVNQISEKMELFFQTNRFLKSLNFIQNYSLEVVNRFETKFKDQESNLVMFKGTFDVRNVPLWVKPDLTLNLVTNINLDIT